jgi:hypothetical protein
MTTAGEIISVLTDLGVTIRVQGDNLALIPKSKVPVELAAELHIHKPELMVLLVGMCFCKAPMPRAVVDGPLCKRCGLSGWCVACQRCRWCAFQLRWQDNLLPKYRQHFK